MGAVSSGISVIEIPPRGQTIPVMREGVTAFIGPAPRGPVDVPVAVRSLDEFLDRFGVAGYLSRMEFLLHQYFENGGTLAVVVRICHSRRHNRLILPGPAGSLVLEAVNPGPLEHLRASVDYECLPAGGHHRFNLVIHRCRTPEHPLVEEQESYNDLSVCPEDEQYVGHALATSALVRLCGLPPVERPGRTIGGDAAHPVRYVYSQCEDAIVGAIDNTPTDYDLVGSREEGTGLFALEQIPWVDFVCLVSGVSGTTLGPVALFAADRYCRERHAMLVIDPSSPWVTVGDVVRSQRERGFSSPNAMTYFPPLECPPHVSVTGTLSAAGAIAGRLCAAGLGQVGALPLSLGRSRPLLGLDESAVHRLARLGVNPLDRPAPARVELQGLVTMARCGGVATSWNNLQLRRLFLFIAGSVSHYTRWAVYETAGPALWQEVGQQCAGFLRALHGLALLCGESPRDAFYVKCDTDTQDGLDEVVLVIGVALVRSGEFVAFEVRHTVGQCRVTEIGWQPGPALALAG